MASEKQIIALLEGAEREPRGSAASFGQLRKDHKIILLWLAKEEGVINYEQAVHGGREKEIATLKRVGIFWNPKKFFDGPLTASQISATSRRLRKLQDKGLVLRYDSKGLIINTEKIPKKPAFRPHGSQKQSRKRVPESRTAHVKLTEDGHKAVAMLVFLGKSYREARKALQEAQKAGESDPVGAALGKAAVLRELDPANRVHIAKRLYGNPDSRRAWICACAYADYDLLVQEAC